MNIVFYLSAAVAILATILVITRLNAVHALLYLIVSLLSVALIFYTLGAPFIAALEVILYAGAIMVLFLFVIMMYPGVAEREGQWLQPGAWLGPGLLAAILLAELVYLFTTGTSQTVVTAGQSPQQVGIVLFGPYLLGVELSSLLLLSGLVGAFHLGRRESLDESKGGLS